MDNTQEQVGNISRNIKTLRKNQKEMLAIKTSVTNVNNIFYGLINRLDTVEERINELEEMFNKKSPKLKCKEKEILKKKKQNPQDRISKNCGTVMKGVTYA